MIIEHNSRLSLYRTPFGAVEQESVVTLRLYLADFGIPHHIKVVMADENGEQTVNMSYVYALGEGYMYQAEITMPKETGLIFYYFDVASDKGRFYYGNNELCLGGMGKIYSQKPEKMFQITIYEKGFKTPDWWKKSVCYQIFPDRFANGNEDGSFLGNRSDIIRRNWGEMPYYKPEQFGGEYLANDFFGGNLLGIEKKLDYLADLGISAIYLNPIFKAYSNHKYDTGDYKEIDEMFGTTADFERLCKKAREKGISVILDGVFNHTGSDSRYFNKKGTYQSVGAYQSEESEYANWYRFSRFPDEYESWWGIDTLPQVEENSADYQSFILTHKDAVIKHWLKKGASGWRLDVVDELPDFFVKILRAEAKKQNPDAVIIGEVWEDASNKVAYGEKRQYFMGRELDSVMNYPLKNALIDFAKGRISAEELDMRIMSLRENYPRECFYALFNFLSSHDTQRVLTALGDSYTDNKDEQAVARLSYDERATAKKRLRALVTMQMLLPGVPVIYYGDEAGLEGYRDPFSRQCYPWGYEDKEIMEFYRELIRIRNSDEAFLIGELETVYSYGMGYGFVRQNGKKKFLVITNMGDSETMRVDLGRFGGERLSQVGGCREYISMDGIYFVPMDRYEAVVFEIL